MLFVLMAGIGFAAIRDPESFASDVFENATIGLLMYATVRAAWTERREGAGWLGFALFGWAILVGKVPGHLLPEWLFWRGFALFLAEEEVQELFDRIWRTDYAQMRGLSVLQNVITLASGVFGAFFLGFLARRTNAPALCGPIAGPR